MIITVSQEREQEEMPVRATGFAHLYPNITRWVQSYGWIEIGLINIAVPWSEHSKHSGLVWESKENDAVLDEALHALESFLAQRMKEYYA